MFAHIFACEIILFALHRQPRLKDSRKIGVGRKYNDFEIGIKTLYEIMVVIEIEKNEMVKKCLRDNWLRYIFAL